MTCLVCASSDLEKIEVLEKKQTKMYYSCANCQFVFLSPKQRLNSAQEKLRYEKHENDVSDEGYQNFVRPLSQEVTKRISKTSKLLDFGCGPNSAISYILKNAGFDIVQYDPYFFPQTKNVVESSYDGIILCEVAEHFYNPLIEFKKLAALLKPAGTLFVMTSLLTPKISFSDWSYRRDETHVGFYTEKTFSILKNLSSFSELKVLGPNIILLKKEKISTTSTYV